MSGLSRVSIHEWEEARVGIRVCFVVIAVLVLTATPKVAFADADGARACRAKLTAVGKQMFDAVAPHVRGGADLPSLMRRHVRPLVMSGALSRSQAQANAPAVGVCLSLLQN